MIDVVFTESVPLIARLCAVGFYEEDLSVPKVLAAALACKPFSQIVEVIAISNGEVCRTLAARLGRREVSTRSSREELGRDLLRRAAEGIESCLLLDIRPLGDDGLDVLMGALLATWNYSLFGKAKRAREQKALKKIEVLCRDAKAAESSFKRLHSVAVGVHYARSLTSEPPNTLPPKSYAERLEELQSLGIQVEVLDEKRMAEIGMTAMLTVGQGSCHPPRLALLTWKGGRQEEPPIVVAGKGVCFDSGGVCLKPIHHQFDMKWDKAGAGVVAGLMKVLALSKVPVHVVGVLGLVENMPDGAAMKPGDVIMTMSGQTVEIVNTDAEGRLVLADCLWYAQERFKPRKLIDLGTLTVETFASLGAAYAGLYTANQQLAEELLAAGEVSGDRLWRLPMGPFFARQIESPVADMKNVGIDFCGENGAAAEFLKRFVKEGVAWAHIDIAGVSWTFEGSSASPKQVTGYGVRLLEEWIAAEVRPRQAPLRDGG